MAKEKDNAPFKVRCHHCGQVIDSVMLDCFNHDGHAEDVKHKFNCVGYNSFDAPFVEVTTAAEWTGKKLSTEEQIKTITCPKCGKYPFGYKSNRAYGSDAPLIAAVPPSIGYPWSIVMFADKKDVECSEALKVDTSHGDSPMDTSAADNVQKMREALSDIIDKIDKWRTDGSMEHWQYSQLFDIADAALSAPPRNCDRFKTAHEAAIEFNYLWNFVWKIGGGIVDGPSYQRRVQEWLFAEAKGETDGSK